MNTHLVIAAGLLSLTTAVRALEIPRGIHRVSDTTKATEEATKSKKGILWVLSDSSLKPT